MNILYIGPYRNQDILGILSQDIIFSLESDNRINLYIQALIDKTIHNTKPADSILSLEKKNIFEVENYDYIIQHSTEQSVAYKSPYFNKTKFIWIPILPMFFNKTILHTESINSFDYIFIDSEHIERMLNKNNIRIYNYYNSYNTQQKINLGISHNELKFYYIAPLENNEEILKSIVTGFYMALLSNPNIKLIIYLPDVVGNKSKTDYLSHMMKTIKNNLGIKYMNKHHFIMDLCDISLVSAVHNSCDVLINLDCSGTTIGFNKYLCDQNNNLCIDYNDVHCIPTTANNKSYEFYKQPSPISIGEVILNRSAIAEDKQPVPESKIPTIKELINSL